MATDTTTTTGLSAGNFSSNAIVASPSPLAPIDNQTIHWQFRSNGSVAVPFVGPLATTDQRYQTTNNIFSSSQRIPEPGANLWIVGLVVAILLKRKRVTKVAR